MKKILFFMLCCCVAIAPIYAEELQKNATDANIFGHVLDKATNEHLPYVTLRLKGTTVGTTTDASGHYFLKNLPTGNFVLEISMIGYKTLSRNVEIKKGTTLELNFEMQEDAIALDGIVVSANRNETTRRTAPSLVSVIDMKTFEATNSNSLSQGLKFQPGLRVENNCQNCGFSQARINGLDGPYSQILIDSRPIIGALAGVYGLEQIPASMIERVEVIRGGGSALFGSSAIGGIINIITKEPLRNSGDIQHTYTSFGKGAWENNTAFNASIIDDHRRAGIMVYGQHRDRKGFDYDGDGFTELPALKNRTLGFRSFIKTGIYSKITAEYHNMHEFRRGGDNLNRPPHEARIAEQLEHYINGGNLKYDQSTADGKNKFSLYASMQHTLRKSYYGGGDPATAEMKTIKPGMTEKEIEEYNKIVENNNNRLLSYGRTTELIYQLGGQYMHAFDNLWFMPAELTGGLEYTGNKLNDAGGYRKEGINQTTQTGSAFLQNEWKTNQWSFLIGGRLDKHNLVRKAIVSPRINVRYNPIEDINLRLTYSEGFRAPQFFDEDLHVDIAGGEQVVRTLSKDLKEERSRSFSGSVDFYHRFNNVQLNFLVEGFYTQLNNPFKGTKKGTEIVVENDANGARVYGINIEGRAAIASKFQLQGGATIQRSRYKEAGKWWEPENDNPEEIAKDKVEPTKRMMRTPDVYGYFVATWTPLKAFSATLSGTYTGKMLVAHEAGTGVEGKDRFSKVNITEETPAFFELNAKLGYDIALFPEVTLGMNLGIQNIFNAYQKDFDTGAGRASAYIYGPGTPRSLFAGLKISF